MFGNKYKEDASKWRAHQKASDDDFLKGRAKCEVTVHLIGGESVCYVNEASSYVSEYGTKYTASYKIQKKLHYDIDSATKSGLKINNTHYMPHTILRLEMGEIEEYTE